MTPRLAFIISLNMVKKWFTCSSTEALSYFQFNNGLEFVKTTDTWDFDCPSQ
jgi:hypothetical protein